MSSGPNGRPAAPLERFAVFHTHDADAAEVAGGAVFSSHRLLAPRDAEFEAAINALDVGEIRLIHMHYASPVEIRSRTPLGYYSAHLPLRGGGRIHYGPDGAEGETDACTAAVFSPGDEPRMRWGGDLRQLAVKIPERSLVTHLETLTAQPARTPLVLDHRMGGSPDRQRWLHLLRMVVGIVDQQHERTISPVLTRQLEQMLLSGLLMTQPSNYSDQLRTPVASAAPRAVRDAAELMRARPGDPWTVGDLARRTGVSVRSLQEGFRRAHGTTPIRFLRDARLDRSRALLLDDTCAPRSVTDVAMALGFSNVGRFSAAYRERFGVLPSHRGRPPH